MNFKALSIKGKEYLLQLEEERKQFIIRNNAIQKIIEKSLTELFKNTSSKDDMTPRLGIDVDNIFKHLNDSSKDKKTEDNK
jgi:hypothetical protein